MTGPSLDADERRRFDAFFRREYTRLVFFVAACGYTAYAEDASGDAMRELLRKWKTVDSPVAWTRVVAVRYAQQALKRDRERCGREDRYVQLVSPTVDRLPEAIYEWTRANKEIFDWIESLPPRRRQIVALAFDGYGVKDIAALLAIKESTVRSHLRHARGSRPDFLSSERGAQ